jgi:hypothetical protein
VTLLASDLLGTLHLLSLSRHEQFSFFSPLLVRERPSRLPGPSKNSRRKQELMNPCTPQRKLSWSQHLCRLQQLQLLWIGFLAYTIGFPEQYVVSETRAPSQIQKVF